MLKGTRIFYTILAWLFPLAILVQVSFVGFSLFTGQPYWEAHIGFGHTIVLLPLLMVILMYFARLSRAMKILTWTLFGTCLVQTEVFAAIREALPTLAAFHPVLALVLFALAVVIAIQSRALLRPSRPIPAPSPAEQHATV